MSAMRTRLLAAAALCGVLAPTANCWAQAYGSKAVVDHNDLRWFEPVELDLDGQMPRRDAGFFFSVEKVYWGVGNPRVEIGSPGLVVDSEQVLRPPTVGQALSVLEERQQITAINTVGENLATTGISFVVADTQGTPQLSDDVETEIAFAPGVLSSNSFLALELAIGTVQAGLGANQELRVGGAPRPYTVRNGIRDALPDAGFDFGERYEFGYSDGEQGWRVTILDGPQAEAGGTFGVGNGNLGDNPNDGSGLALGFGSVPVNFELPSPDFLTGFRDYFDNDDGFSGGTQFGPLLFVRTVGQVGVDQDNLGVAPTTLTGDATIALGALATNTIATTGIFDTQQMLGNPDEPLLIASVNLIVDQLSDLSNFITLGTPADMADPMFVQFQAAQNQVQAAIAAAVILQNDLNTDIGNGGGMATGGDNFDAQITALNAALLMLSGTVSTLTVDVMGGDGDADIVLGDAQRLADDINGNGLAGQTIVRADIDGNGIIADDEIIGIIPDFGDLFNFNVFFDDVTVRNRTEIDGVELMRTHELSTRHKLEQGRWDQVQFSWGARFLDVKDDFSFVGTGSILGATGVETDVENQIIGPQFGLKWIRRDGPWDFVVEGRGTLGYNIVDVDQRGVFGVDAIPGALNRSAIARTTASVDSVRYDEFSPLGELRAQLRYRLAKSVTLQAGYTATYVANVHRGSLTTRFALPDFGFNDTTSDIFVNGVNFGVEFRH